MPTSPSPVRRSSRTRSPAISIYDEAAKVQLELERRRSSELEEREGSDEEENGSSNDDGNEEA